MRTKIGILLLPILFFICVPPDSMAVDKNNRTYDVIIVGGGIAGLTAAFFLGDYDLLVLEKEKQVGGRATSGQYQGISYARGTEYLAKPEAPLAEIISTLGLTLREIPSPADVIFHSGKMFSGDYGKASLMVSQSSLGEFNRFAEKILTTYKDYDDIPNLVLRGELQRLDTITARQWFEENHFAPIYSDIYNVTFRGLFGANSDEISALSALPELAFDFEGFEHIAEDDDLAEEFSDDGNSTGMYSFTQGIAEIPLAIASHLGDQLRTGTTVTGVRRTGDLFEVTCAQADNTTVTYQTQTVILATPSAITLNIAGEALSEEQRQILGSVSYAPYATIALFSEVPIFNQGFDLAVPDGLLFTDIYDATWISRRYNNKPKIQQGWVTLVYAAPVSYRDTALLTMPDRELMNTILTQLDHILPASSGLIKQWEITRFRYGYPVMAPGSYQRMTRLQAITGGGLYLAGDYLVYPTFEAAASSGQLAAHKVMEWFED